MGALDTRNKVRKAPANKMYIEKTEMYLMEDLHQGQIEDVEQRQRFADEVSAFYPATIKFRVSIQDAKTYYEGTEVFIDPFIDIVISPLNKDGYAITCRGMERFRNLCYNQKHEACKGIIQPNRMKILSTKKITDWVTFHRECYASCLRKDKENLAKKTAFLESFGNYPVVISADKSSGYMTRNGLTFTFRIHESYISTNIDLARVDHEFEDFIALSANSYRK